MTTRAAAFLEKAEHVLDEARKDDLLKQLASLGEIKRQAAELIHTTDAQATVDKIVDKGFSLRYFGKTGKRFGTSMTQHDPKGVYATPLKKFILDKSMLSYVEFEVPRATIFANDTIPANELKAQLWDALEAKSSQDLAKKLKTAGIDIVATDSEWIVLDPKAIRITDHS